MNKPMEKPESYRYTKYYEQDGRLRAYANRMSLLTILFAALAVGNLSFAIYVRSQPAKVFRVDSAGNAALLGDERKAVTDPSARLLLANESSVKNGPTDIERIAVVRKFLKLYLAYTPETVAENIADALNMMTPNFSSYTLGFLSKAQTVREVKEKSITSDFQITSLELVGDTKWTYFVTGYKEVHHADNAVERIDRIVGHYHIRLLEVPRSYQFSNGLAVAEYYETQGWGDQQTGLLQESSTDKQK